MSSCGGRTDLQAQHRQQSCKRGLGGPVGSASGCGPGRPCLCTAGCVCVCGVHVEARCVGGAHGPAPGPAAAELRVLAQLVLAEAHGPPSPTPCGGENARPPHRAASGLSKTPSPALCGTGQMEPRRDAAGFPWEPPRGGLCVSPQWLMM